MFVQSGLCYGVPSWVVVDNQDINWNFCYNSGAAEIGGISYIPFYYSSLWYFIPSAVGYVPKHNKGYRCRKIPAKKSSTFSGSAPVPQKLAQHSSILYYLYQTLIIRVVLVPNMMPDNDITKKCWYKNAHSKVWKVVVPLFYGGYCRISFLSCLEVILVCTILCHSAS